MGCPQIARGAFCRWHDLAWLPFLVQQNAPQFPAFALPRGCLGVILFYVPLPHPPRSNLLSLVPLLLMKRCFSCVELFCCSQNPSRWMIFCRPECEPPGAIIALPHCLVPGGEGVEGGCWSGPCCYLASSVRVARASCCCYCGSSSAWMIAARPPVPLVPPGVRELFFFFFIKKMSVCISFAASTEFC